MDFEKIIKFEPAFDKRDPDPSKNYGIHGVELGFYLKGPHGTVQFKLFTNWHVPGVRKERETDDSLLQSPHISAIRCAEIHFGPSPADLGYHSPKPMYEDQTMISSECPWVEGGECYYDGSGLAAERIFDVLTEKGDEGVWEELESYYRSTFLESDE
jgi:hypothetical protein